MGFQLSPGVNVSEIDLTNVVPAVSSSIGAFAGQFSWGPAGIRALVDSENRLVSTFGKPTNENFTSFFTAANFLAYTNNLRVVRAIDNTKTFNSTTISEFINLGSLTANTVSGNTRVTFSSDIANYLSSGDTFKLTTGGSTFTLTANTVSGNIVNVVTNDVGNSNNAVAVLPTSQTDVSIANEDDYQLNFDAGTYSKFGSFFGRYPSDLGNSLTVSMCSSNASFSQTGFTANTVINVAAVTLDVGYANTFLTVGDKVKVAGTDYTISGFTSASSTQTVLAISSFANATTTGGAIASTRWAYADEFDSKPTSSVYATNSKGSLNDELHIIVIDTDGKFTGEKGTILEKFSHVSKAQDAKTDDGSPSYYVTKILNESKYIYVANHQNGSTNWGDVLDNGLVYDKLKNYYNKLGRGTNVAPTAGDLQLAYDLFGNADEVDISLLLTGDADLTLANHCLDIVNQRRDCVAFISPLKIDAVDSINLDNIVEYRNLLTPSTSYSVFDSGWKYQFDKYNNKYRYVPLNGDIAGLCARTDNVRDPWWSPAGFNRGQILNAIKLSWNPTKAQRDELYKNGINPVVAFPGEGIILYGDKTMQTKPSAFDRINVRRLFIVLEKAISIAAKYSLFEFNDTFTRAQFVSMVEPFLRDVKGRRGIYDFSVICDETNNTAEVIDTNRFIGDIYIKPARSINFIQLNFVAVRTGVDFTEIAGKF
jgi:phage tail sheath protein FI